MEKSTHSKEYSLLRASLRQLRQEAELSQRDLAARLKLPHSWVAKVESGERRIDVVELYWYVRACGHSPADFFQQLIEQFQGRGAIRGSGGSRKR
jgi:transcriptional regulator with XRE-family HTH domain